MTTRGRKGKLEKSVMVISNDPTTPQLELKVSADIQVLLSIEPDRVFLNQIPKGSKQVQTITLAGPLADKASILSVESNRPELVAMIAKNKREIQLTLLAPNKLERFNASVKVTTDQEAVREITVPVMADVVGDLLLSASAVSFSPYYPDTPSTTIVVVRSRAGKPFTITNVVDARGTVGASFTPKGNPLGSEVEVKLRLDKRPAASHGTLTFQTDRADEPALTVQYFIRPQDPQGPSTLPH